MPSESVKRRERRRRARQAREEADASDNIKGPVLAYADGQTTLTLIRGQERMELTPTRESLRQDVFTYWPRTLAVRGLTLLALSWGWRLENG